MINEAALLTVREGRAEMDQPTLEEAIDRVVAGPARKSHVLTAEERWVISIHEASHAVVTRSIGQKVSAQKLSIVARGRQLGTAASMLTDRDAVVMQEPDLRRHLIAIVAGYAGEKLEFNVVSSGVHDDIHTATALARSMVASYGMSDELGPVTIGEKEGEVFLGASLQELGSVGPATLELIDREVERIVKDSVLAGGGDPARQLERGLRDRQRADRAGDALRRRARRRALDGRGDPDRLHGGERTRRPEPEPEPERQHQAEGE